MEFIHRLRNFDWVLLGAVAFLACASLVMLYSYNQTYFFRQLAWYSIAFCIIIFGSRIDWRSLTSQTWFRYGLYWLSIAFLVFSNLQKGTVRGTRSWLSIAGFQFEPSELAKLALIFILAHFFSRKYIAAWQYKNIFLSLLYTAIPAFLVIIHPDFGSTIIILSLWLVFFLAGGVRAKRFVVGMVLAMIGVVCLWTFVFKQYQKDRITGFLFPERDPLGVNYNVIQSKIAIGSAGFWGKGFQGGTQTQLKFLPEAQTDFLFAAFVEEWGVFGGLVLLAVFGTVLYRVIRIGLRAGDNYSRFIVLGTGSFLIVHFFINVGSNIGLVPVAGITFPFFSYGGSNLLTTATLLSIIEHIKLESR